MKDLLSPPKVAAGDGQPVDQHGQHHRGAAASDKGWSKERQRALYQPFILIAQIAALVLLQAMSASSGKPLGVGLDSLTYVPAMLLGTVLGLACFRRLNDRQFQIAVNLLLIVSGVSLVV